MAVAAYILLVLSRLLDVIDKLGFAFVLDTMLIRRSLPSKAVV